ncbi:MAG TPA: type II toxin-antitoxin system Phd/YefM family antitoxin [Actinomycetota bacterium]|nr:type II toxin-antitoxin system Phd/YefM family antitoxin [Actinomycetota bacterium]
MVWKLQDAKQRLSEVVRRALTEGPQVVTRHGEAVVVVLSAERYEELVGERPSFVEFLLEGPPFDDLELERSSDMPREVAL